MHSECRLGASKALSVAAALADLNSEVRVSTHVTSLSSSNALDILAPYAVVVDATDNVASRYLLNDACVMLKKPLISGSALRFEGQLTVYNYECAGPTYRCLFPVPPPPETVTNCSDGGVLGVIPGTIGVLQAFEAIKIIAGVGEVMSGRMTLFDGLDGTFRTVKLRKRRADVAIEKLVDYEQFCGTGAHDKDEPLKLLEAKDRIKAKELADILKASDPPLLVDVRSAPEMDICAIPGSKNVPLSKLLGPEGVERVRQLIIGDGGGKIIVVCRKGNDSQVATAKLMRELGDAAQVKDVIGGLHAWAREVDESFPVY